MRRIDDASLVTETLEGKESVLTRDATALKGAVANGSGALEGTESAFEGEVADGGDAPCEASSWLFVARTPT